MKKLIVICAVLILVQTGLILLTNHVTHIDGSSADKGVLLDVAASEVNELLLEDSAHHTLLLKKIEGTWQLPELSSFPADNFRVRKLVEQLTSMQRGWPEATTAEAASRFKVASDRFERKLTLRDTGKALKVVYFGTSPGLRKLYFRVDGDAEIHTMAIAQQELEVRADSWIDTRVLHLKPEQVMGVNLPNLHLIRQKDGFNPVDLKPEEEVIAEKRDALVKRLTGLTIDSVLGTESKPEYGLDAPVLRYSLKLDGGTQVEYIFGRQAAAEKKEEQGALPEQSYVLKVSNRDQLFRVDGWQVEDIKRVDRASLVRHKPPKNEAGPQLVPPGTPVHREQP